ncbi:MAG: DUF4056 domain-containing protein [Myxococcota bacterium]|nr:DUF4056 domain-containing protein [Myxococcota bacterium]
MGRTQSARRLGGTRVAGLALLLVASLLVAACAPASRWRAKAVPRSADLPLLLESPDPSDMMEIIHPGEVPDIPIRKRLRPCCAFGAELQAKLGPIPIPFYSISNVLGPEDLGPHTYDSGVLLVKYGEAAEVLLNQERNGLVYTCRGGFIDTAHVRDYADWAVYVAAQIGRALETGVTIDLGDEGGARRVVVSPIPRERLEDLGRRRTASGLAHWLVFHMSIYHEIVTWFGWAAVPGFSEFASSFSPEDLYSNLLGVKLTSASILRFTANTERQYNRSIGDWLQSALEYLEPVPQELGIEASADLDGHWWNSKARLPDPDLVLRRNFDNDAQVAPWTVPSSLASPALREACAGFGPVALSNPDSLDDLHFPDVARLEVDVPSRWRKKEPWKRFGPQVTQADFPELIEWIRAEARERYGPRADLPD